MAKFVVYENPEPASESEGESVEALTAEGAAIEWAQTGGDASEDIARGNCIGRVWVSEEGAAKIREYEVRGTYEITYSARVAT